VDTDSRPALAHDKREIEAWIDQAKHGSQAALGKLLDACRLYMLELARERVAAPLAAKFSASDLVQETSLDAHRDFANFRGQRLEELLAWLRQIMLYNAANARRRYQVNGKRDAFREIPLNGSPAVAEALADEAPSPRSQLAGVEETQMVEQALGRLSDDHRQVIVLRSREHLSFVEIGRHMDRSADAARKLWFRAVERLQDELSGTP
jgi:RNA polymerase sigma-70 factor (ECF subfamily)